jgi:pimeloyl-ACP methyl ester carboxylesterase
MRIAIGDVRLFFEVEGAKLTVVGAAMRERPSLLLLHGGPGFDHSLFKPRFEKLRDQFQLIYLDQRGNGASDRGSASSWRLEQWADDIPSLLWRARARETDPARRLVRWNRGAGLRHSPPRPCRRVGALQHHWKISIRPRTGHIRAPRRQPSARGSVGILRWAFFANPGRLRANLPPALHSPSHGSEHARSMRSQPGGLDLLLHPRVAKLRFPSRAVTREVPDARPQRRRRPITPMADGQDLAAALPAATTRFEHFAGCGHPVYEDDEDRCFATIREFLNERLPGCRGMRKPSTPMHLRPPPSVPVVERRKSRDR